MKVQARALAEITQQATHILCKEIGVVNTIRFINQFSTGYGDYTKEREEWLGELSLDDIVSEIKRMRKL